MFKFAVMTVMTRSLHSFAVGLRAQYHATSNISSTKPAARLLPAGRPSPLRSRQPLPRLPAGRLVPPCPQVDDLPLQHVWRWAEVAEPLPEVPVQVPLPEVAVPLRRPDFLRQQLCEVPLPDLLRQQLWELPLPDFLRQQLWEVPLPDFLRPLVILELARLLVLMEVL